MPIIVVFTKADLLIAKIEKRKNESSQQLAERHFKERYRHIYEKSCKNIVGQIPYALVSSAFLSDATSSALISLPSIASHNFETTGPDHDAKSRS